MPLLLTDDDAEKVLTMEECLKSLENAFKQEATGAAANRTKATIYIRASSGSVCQYVSMEGGIQNPPVFVLSVRTQVPLVSHSDPSGTNVLMLFDGNTGNLLAFLKRKTISCFRVAGTAALAAREMARSDAKVVGILGSGGQARSLASPTRHSLQWGYAFHWGELALRRYGRWSLRRLSRTGWPQALGIPGRNRGDGRTYYL